MKDLFEIYEAGPATVTVQHGQALAGTYTGTKEIISLIERVLEQAALGY